MLSDAAGVEAMEMVTTSVVENGMRQGLKTSGPAIASPRDTQHSALSTHHSSLAATSALVGGLAALREAVRRPAALALVVGEAGAGKTALRLALQHDLFRDPAFLVAVVDDPRACRTDLQFLRTLLARFDLPSLGRTGLELTTELGRFAETAARDGRRLMIAIDDGLQLSSSQLEILRAILSWGGEATAVAVVVFSRPGLAEKIARKRNLARRIVLHHIVSPADRSDAALLLTHRLRAPAPPDGSGWRATDEAIELIVQQAGGVPGRLVELADACLAVARPRRTGVIDAATVAAALARRSDEREPGAPRRPVTSAQLALDFPLLTDIAAPEGSR